MNCSLHPSNNADAGADSDADSHEDAVADKVQVDHGDPGYEDRGPVSMSERIFTVLVLIFGWFVSAAFVGSLTTAMTRLHLIASKTSHQFSALNRYLSDYGISRELSLRVHQNARFALKEQTQHTPERNVELMALISEPLRSEIHYEMYEPVLEEHPFFYLHNTVNPISIRHICHTAVEPVSLSQGDVIFSEFEVPEIPLMRIVVRGTLEYIHAGDKHYIVSSGSWVSEAVLWTKWAHRGTMRALTQCRLLSVDARQVSKIMSMFPTQATREYAQKFVESLNDRSINCPLSDLSEGMAMTRRMAVDAFDACDEKAEVPQEWQASLRGRRSSLCHGRGKRRPSVDSRQGGFPRQVSTNSVSSPSHHSGLFGAAHEGFFQSFPRQVSTNSVASHHESLF